MHPSQELQKVLIRLGSCTGLTTSGVEQSFSKTKQLMNPQRSGCGQPLQRDEAVLYLVDKSFVDAPHTFKLAQSVWCKLYGSPRNAGKHPRVDKGVPRKTKVAM
eukprot:2030329-Amphidinium_carterae.1